MAGYDFRLGSTSYVYADDILPNVRQLGPVVDDIELVLFESDGYSNMPGDEVIAELSQLKQQHSLTYTVHLPLDLRIAEGDPSLELAKRVINLTKPLEPWAYVAHLNAKEPMCTGDWATWRESSLKGLEALAPAVGDLSTLCIENLERWPYTEMLPILDRLPVSFCLDIGHLWLEGLDAPPRVRQLVPRTRVVHLHGVAERDHKSLAHMPRMTLYGALDALNAADYHGVVTLEVFSVEDFFGSRELVQQWGSTRA